MKNLSQPIKRHGGKSYFADRILELMPPRAKNPNAPAPDEPGWLHYVEPYFGGGAVLLAQDPEGIGEVVCDIDGDLTNFWKVLADHDAFSRFQRLIEATPCSEQEFGEAQAFLELEPLQACPDHERAAAFFVVNRQSRQAIGKDFATIARSRTRRGMNELPSAWLTAVEGLPEVHARLKRVVILGGDGSAVVKQQDGPRTLFYCDPPYLHETRTVKDAYQHEMTEQQHRDLLFQLSMIDGRFLLSGYRSELYDGFADRHGWRRVEWETDNKSGGGKKKQKRVECLWMNYEGNI